MLTEVSLPYLYTLQVTMTHDLVISMFNIYIALITDIDQPPYWTRGISLPKFREPRDQGPRTFKTVCPFLPAVSSYFVKRLKTERLQLSVKRS